MDFAPFLRPSLTNSPLFAAQKPQLWCLWIEHSVYICHSSLSVEYPIADYLLSPCFWWKSLFLDCDSLEEYNHQDYMQINAQPSNCIRFQELVQITSGFTFHILSRGFIRKSPTCWLLGRYVVILRGGSNIRCHFCKSSNACCKIVPIVVFGRQRWTLFQYYRGWFQERGSIPT